MSGQGTIQDKARYDRVQHWDGRTEHGMPGYGRKRGRAGVERGGQKGRAGQVGQVMQGMAT